jgi:hypothetical protein
VNLPDEAANVKGSGGGGREAVRACADERADGSASEQKRPQMASPVPHQDARRSRRERDAAQRRTSEQELAARSPRRRARR